MTDLKEVDIKVDSTQINEVIAKLKSKLKEESKEIVEKNVLTDSQILVIQFLLDKNESLITNLVNLVKEIIKDNVINTKDIPYLILFIKDLYSFMYLFKKDLKHKSKDLQSMIFPITKYLIGELVKENLDLPAEHLVLLNDILENTINVLQLSTNLKTEKCKLLKFW